MKILRNILGKKEAESKISTPSQLPDSIPANKITPEELNSFIQELLTIDRTEGLMQRVDREIPEGSIEYTYQPHRRGREIGQILADSVCDDGVNITGDLMKLAFNIFGEKGGTKSTLDVCWDRIKDRNGKPCWHRYPPFIAGPG